MGSVLRSGGNAYLRELPELVEAEAAPLQLERARWS